MRLLVEVVMLALAVQRATVLGLQLVIVIVLGALIERTLLRLTENLLLDEAALVLLMLMVALHIMR